MRHYRPSPCLESPTQSRTIAPTIESPCRRKLTNVDRQPIQARQALQSILRVHSAYSLLEGALPRRLRWVGHVPTKDGAPAIAVTDTNNLFGALGNISQYAVKAGVQPIIGCQLDIALSETLTGGGDAVPGGRVPGWPPLVLIAAYGGGLRQSRPSR